MNARVPLCRLDDIPDGDSNGFFAPVGEQWYGYLAVRRGEDVFVYVNSCPHTGAPLNLLPGQFLNTDKTLISCCNHGALFRIEDGFCIKGPCAGKTLQPVAVTVEGGEVFVAAPAGC